MYFKCSVLIFVYTQLPAVTDTKTNTTGEIQNNNGLLMRTLLQNYSQFA